MPIQKNAVVAIFGDSIPEGVVTENGAIEKLEDCAPNILSKKYGFTLNNMSIYGQTLTRMANKHIIENYLSNIDKTKNNVAVISIGGNDSDFNWQAVATSPEIEHQPKTPIDDFEKMLTYYVNLLKSNNIMVFLTTITPVDSKKYFENVICKIADGNNVLKYFKGDISVIQRHQESYNAVISKVASKNSVYLIDIRTPFLLDRNFLDKMCADGIHPNAEGHKFMAQQIEKQLNNI